MTAFPFSESDEIAETIAWWETLAARLAEVNKGVPPIRTAMDQPGYWEEKHRAFQRGEETP